MSREDAPTRISKAPASTSKRSKAVFHSDMCGFGETSYGLAVPPEPDGGLRIHRALPEELDGTPRLSPYPYQGLQQCCEESQHTWILLPVESGRPDLVLRDKVGMEYIREPGELWRAVRIRGGQEHEQLMAFP